MIDKLDCLLTPTQCRRFLGYTVDGRSMTEIADSESVSIQSVSDSIRQARRRLEKHLEQSPHIHS